MPLIPSLPCLLDPMTFTFFTVAHWHYFWNLPISSPGTHLLCNLLTHKSLFDLSLQFCFTPVQPLLASFKVFLFSRFFLLFTIQFFYDQSCPGHSSVSSIFSVLLCCTHGGSSDAGHRAVDTPCCSCPSAARENHLPSNSAVTLIFVSFGNSAYCTLIPLSHSCIVLSFPLQWLRPTFSPLAPRSPTPASLPADAPTSHPGRQSHKDSCASFTSTFTLLRSRTCSSIRPSS